MNHYGTDPGEVGLRQGERHMPDADRGYPVPALVYQPGTGGKGHLLAQRQHQGFEKLGVERRTAAATQAIG